MSDLDNYKYLIKAEYEVLDLMSISSQEIGIIKGLNPFHATKFSRKGINTIGDLAKLKEEFKDPNIENDQLSKWVRSAQLLCYYERMAHEGEKSYEPTILFMGLENSGKTALIQTLTQQKASTSTMATEDVEEYNEIFLGTRFHIKDLPGKKELRDKYIQEPEKYIGEPIIVFFTFDSTKGTRVADCIKYLDQILKYFDKKTTKKPLFSFLITKYDSEYRPQLSDQQSTESHVRMRIQELMKAYNLTEFEVNRTSIFNLRTIIEACYKTFRKASMTSSILDLELKYYAELHSVLGCYLIDQNGMITGQWASRMASNIAVQLYEELFLEIQKATKIPIGDKQFIFSRKKRVTQEIRLPSIRAYMTLVPIGTIPFYLVVADTSLEGKDPSIVFGQDFEAKVLPWIINYFVSFHS